MNLEHLKSVYLDWLNYKAEKTGNVDPSEYENLNNDVSIFMNMNEFKQYLVEENYAGADIYTKSLSEIEEMDFVNGKLVEIDDTIDAQNLTENQETPEPPTDNMAAKSADSKSDTANVDTKTIQSSDLKNSAQKPVDINSNESSSGNVKLADLVYINNISNDKKTAESSKSDSKTYNNYKELLKDMYNDDEVLKYIDEDGNGKLSSEEKTKFETFVKGDDKEVDLKKLQKIYDSMKDGSFDADSYKNFNVNSGEAKSDTTVNSPTNTQGNTTPAASAGGGGGVSGSSGTGGVSSGSGNQSLTSATQTSDMNGLDSMTVEELEKERDTKKNEVEDAQKSLDDVYSGKNENVKAAEKEYQDAKKEYDEAVENDDKISDKTKKQRQDNIKKIEKKQTEIDDTNSKINEKQSEISEMESTIDADNAQVNALKETVSALEGMSYPDNPEKQSELDAKLAEAGEALEAAEAKLEQDENQLDALNEELDNLNDSLDTLKDDLAELEKERETIEDEILKNCSKETKQALENFNDAKEQVETVKETEAAEAKEVLDTKRSELSAIDSKINEKKSEGTKKEYGMKQSTLPEGLFQGNLAGQEDLVCEISEKYGVDPVLVASIIAYESGWGTSSLAAQNNFMGYRAAGDAGVSERGFGYFSTVEKGLEATIGNLSEYPSRYDSISAVDYNNIDAIGAIYCEGNTWAGQIKTIYNQIKSQM